jgi:hypothetical protein
MKKKYFVSYLAKNGYGSCVLFIGRKPRDYKDIKDIAEAIGKNYPEFENIVVMYWRKF